MRRNEKSLMEAVRHGTPKEPLVVMHFSSDPDSDIFDGEIFSMDRHWHYHMEILYIRKGTYEFEVDLQQYKVKEGDFCFVNSESLHTLNSNGDYEHSVIIFDPKILDYSFSDLMQEQFIGPMLGGIIGFPAIIDDKMSIYPKLREIFQKICDNYSNGSSTDYMRVKLLISEFILELYENNLMLQSVISTNRIENEKIKRYKKVISYIKDNYQERITLDDLAEVAGCNSSYLCRFFKNICGESPIQQLINYRIEKSCGMLLNTDDSILEIAMSCGFDNVSYFIRQFKREKGVTPGQFRKES